MILKMVQIFIILLLGALLLTSTNGCTITHKHLVEGEADQNVYVIVTGNIPIEWPTENFYIEEVN